MSQEDFNRQLLAFLHEAVTPFHAVDAMTRRLEAAGFARHDRAKPVMSHPGGVFCARAGSIIAVKPGSQPLAESSLRMVGAHTDSPCLMVKPQPEIRSHGYLRLGVEVYGGALLNPWFDRDLSLAGRVSYLTSGGAIATALVDFVDPIAVIPSLAIHLDREANQNRNVNAQTQMAPILDIESDVSLRDLLLSRLRGEHPDAQEVLDFELCFYDTQPAAQIGLHKAFIASARLDNLLSCFTGLDALLNCDGEAWTLLICNDHEEVGSLSATGAQGPMLWDFVRGLLDDSGQFAEVMSRSMMVSADNAHGIHPSYPDKHDKQHGPLLNAGPVIKVNASQRYATSSDGSALLRLMAKAEDIPLQSFAMRADMGCGSTIGPISAGNLGVRTLDIGVPTFAMHSARELAGSDDAWFLRRLLTAFYNRPDPLFLENSK